MNYLDPAFCMPGRCSGHAALLLGPERRALITASLRTLSALGPAPRPVTGRMRAAIS